MFQYFEKHNRRNGAMEAETIKNAAIPKSHTSRRNFFKSKENRKSHAISGNLLTGVILLTFFSFCFASCEKDDENGKVPSSIIPDAIRAQIEAIMPVYSGVKPPDITGEYYVGNAILAGSSLESDAADIGKSSYFAEMYLAFIKLSDGKLTYRDNNNTSPSENINVTVVGKKDNFTAYFIMNTVNPEIGSRAKEAVIISGTMTSQGISDFHYAFIMLEKTDPSDKLVPVNTYRVFNDGNGLAKNQSWR